MQLCIVFRICNGKGASTDQMCRETSVTMRRVVSISNMVSKLVEGPGSETNLPSDQV
jgi:hypothetical protein